MKEPNQPHRAILNIDGTDLFLDCDMTHQPVIVAKT